MELVTVERRTFGKFIARSAAVAIGGNWLRGDPAAVGLPNIVLILADDLGYGDLGCYGNELIRTPNADRMAREGMRFTQFYAASPICSPSRAALMTGRYPIRAGVSRVLHPVSRHGLSPSEVTIAKVLRARGYGTACVGKWHLGKMPRYLPTEHGFDRYFGIPYSNDMSRKSSDGNPLYRLRVVPPLPLMRDNKVIEREPDQALLTRRYTEESIRFIRESVEAKRPFFLYLAHTFPHTPLHASAAFRGKSSAGLYGDVVEELDWSTGEILRALNDAGVDRNTLTMFTSDNGPWLTKGDHGGSAGPLRDGKRSTWEGGVRVPFLAHWPGKVPANVTTDAFGTQMDILPTCARLAGAKLPADRVYDGRDLSPVLLENRPGRPPLLFYWYRDQVRAVRKGPWKLHLMTNEPAKGIRAAVKHDPPLLFHLERDPSESENVAAFQPEIVRELLALVEQHRKSMKAEIRGSSFDEPGN
jgi:arylsulfatase A